MRLLVTILLAVAAWAQNPGPSITGTPSSASSQAATPTFSPTAGSYVGTQSVTISTATGGCGSYIYWSTTNNPPTTSDTHGTSVSVASSETVYAKVIGCPTYTDSAVGSAAYTISATWTPAVATTSGGVSPTMWFKADAIGTCSNTAVSSWADSTANSHTATQATSGHQPQCQASQINGLPAVYFNNSRSDWLAIASPPTLTNATAFVVFKVTYTSGAWLGGGSGGSGLVYFLNGTNNFQTLEGSYDGAIGSGGTDLNGNTWFQVAATWANASAYTFKLYNGSATVSDGGGTSSTNLTGTTAFIGGDHDGTNHAYTGWIAEIVVYPSVLSATDITQVQGYLHSRYGL